MKAAFAFPGLKMRPASFAPLLLFALSTLACASGAPPPALGRPLDPAAERAREAADLAQKGKAAAQAGDSVRAEQYLTLAIERGASRRELLPALLSVCLASSRLRAALNHARSYLQDNPEDDRLRYLVASLHLSLGQRDEARQALQLLLRRRPESADAHYLFGVLDAEETPASARDHFRTYLALEPRGRHGAEARSRLAELLIREESETAASERAEAPLFRERGPRDADAVRPHAGQTWRDVRLPRTGDAARASGGKP